MSRSRWGEVLTNDWVVRIVAGVLVSVVSAYILAALRLSGDTASEHLPKPAAQTHFSIMLTPDNVSSQAHQQIIISISGGTANAGVDLDVYSPTGQQVKAVFVRADDKGTAVVTFAWPPSGGQTPSAGAWKVTAYDTATGAGVIEYLQVTTAVSAASDGCWSY